MFARRLNELRLTVEIRPVDLLLIKEGRHQEGGDKERRVFHRDAHVVRNPPRPRQRDSRNYGDYDSSEGCFDMAFVFSRTAAGAERFYLPGSSLRGVLRSAAERVVARWRPDLVSDPFVNAQAGTDLLRGSDHALRAAQRLDGPTIYRHALPIERCFGHTALRGRWVAADGWLRTGDGDQLQDEPEQFRRKQARMEVRDGVGIDRHTGAAHNKIKYQFEALSGGIFTTTITLVNYERWQPGLLAHALAAVDGGQVRVGYGTRRGLGRVQLAVKAMRWRWYDSDPRHDDGNIDLPRLGDLARGAGLHDNYGWQEPAIKPPGLALALSETDYGWEATIHPAAAKPESNEATDWLAEPWPTLAQLLPPTLEKWQKEAEVTA